MKLTKTDKKCIKAVGITIILFIICNIFVYKLGGIEELKNLYNSPEFSLIIICSILLVVFGFICGWLDRK